MTQRDVPYSEIRDWLSEAVASYLELPVGELDGEIEFTQYGVDSMSLLEIGADFEVKYGLELRASFFRENPTINSAAGSMHRQLVDGVVYSQDRKNDG